ncbi:hypothetical protein SCHPADRAFT_66659 [Schizopora paradoxa]|uniref:F-box domain-containing protein n=1 Tax=Schizopora paradoxa TaxID=27342 RepID=A0A0H2SCT0_9AGAM|nr:hypothetical protein SCHPADRAFT_66659 [Schizopora paradoxa]
MSKRPQRVAKSQALQKVQTWSNVKMEDEDDDEFDEMKSEEGESESESASDASIYDSDENGKKRKKGQRSSGDDRRSAKRPRNNHDSAGDEDPSGTSTEKKPLSRLFRLITGPHSRAARVKGKKKLDSCSNRGLGKLKKLLEVPVEVFCGILEHLHPYDLLSLARSSRALHELIIARRMRGVWQACLEAHDVPPLPDNVPINEVHLACMLFDNSCQACGAAALNKSFHDKLLVRLCKGCLHYNTSPGSKIAITYGKKVSKDKTIYTLLPCIGRNKFLIPDFQDIIEEYIATPPDSDERKKFVANKTDISVAILKESLPLAFLLGPIGLTSTFSSQGCCTRGVRKDTSRNNLRLAMHTRNVGKVFSRKSPSSATRRKKSTSAFRGIITGWHPFCRNRADLQTEFGRLSAESSSVTWMTLEKDCACRIRRRNS